MIRIQVKLDKKSDNYEFIMIDPRTTQFFRNYILIHYYYSYIEEHASCFWRRKSQQRELWKKLGKSYVEKD
jgi:hypothetical protein